MKRYLFIFLGLVSTNCFSAGAFQAERYFKNTGGKIDHIGPFILPPDKASNILNFMLDDRGQLTARNGFTILNTTGSLISTSTILTGGGYHNSTVGSDFFAVIAGTNVYRTGTGFSTTYTNITGTVTVTAGASNLAQHTSLNDQEVFCNESDVPFRVGSSGNALALANAPTKAHTCTTYISYLILGNTTESGTDFPSRIRWSDINNTDSWPALNFVDIEPNDGDKIVSIIPFKDSVYVFKRRSIYRLMSTGLDGPDAFIVRPFSRNIGCYAKNSVRVIPNVGIAFANDHTMYVLGDNELSAYNYSQLEAVGDPIQRTLDTVQHSQWVNMVGAVYPQRYQYWLSISTSGATTTEILVYDYIQKGWTVYSGVNFNMMDQAIDSTGRNILILGDFNGNVYKLDETSTQDTPKNIATPISTSYTTGWLTQDAPDYTKGYKYLYIFTQQSSTASLTAQAAFDYGTSFEYSQTVGLGGGTALYGTALYGTDTYASTGYAVNRFELNREAKAIKLMFTSASTSASINLVGWTLVYQPEDWRQ